MYTICNVVCGTEIPSLIRDYLEELGYDYNDIGFKSFYSGKGVTPIYTGVVIFKFNETETISATSLIKKLTANDKQIQEAQKSLDNVKEKFQELLGKDDEIDEEEKQELLNSLPEKTEVLLIWSTSWSLSANDYTFVSLEVNNFNAINLFH